MQFALSIVLDKDGFIKKDLAIFSSLLELDKYTTTLESSVDIRKKYAKEITSFLEEKRAYLAKKDKKLDITVNLTTPEEEIIERIVNRRVCSNQECKTVYNTKLNPSKVDGLCDKCGAELKQRKDDNEETVRNRLETYYKQSAPIVDYYKNKGLLYSSEVSLKINKMAVDVADEVYEMLTR